MTAYTYAPNKPKTAANYPLMGNPYHHYYPSRDRKILMAVQHITAGMSDFVAPDASAESTIRYSSTTSTKASYHGIVDSDTIQDCLPDDFTAWAQGVTGHAFNSPALSLEIGLQKVNWTLAPAAWVDNTIRNAAIWWAPRVKRYGIPQRVMTNRAEIDRLIAANQMVGFVEHHVLDPVNRSDAGYTSATVTTYPWAKFFAMLKEEIAKLTPVPPPPTPKPPLPAAKYDITNVKRLQTLVETAADGKWGTGTDYRAQNLRAAIMNKSYNVRLVQSIVDVVPDGVPGPKTRAAIKGVTDDLQRIVEVSADGVWGPVSDAAYRSLRIQFLNKF